MKTIVEYLINSHVAKTADYDDVYANTKPTREQVEYPITLAEFIETITPEILTKTLKWCWADAAKDSTMGRFTYIFKDGNLGVEIMTMPSGIRSNGGKWWREAFVLKKNLDPKYPHVASWNYSGEFSKAAENGLCGFKTNWGDRLAKVAPDYIEYLKKHKDDFIK